MIIFDLDGTLADCEHRRHFVVNSEKNYPAANLWKSDWQAFYEACDQDIPIKSTIHVLNHLILLDNEIQIWSDRSESVREKTEKWLEDHVFGNDQYPILLKMRPVGDSTPDDVLKENWLFELCKIDPNYRPPGIKFIHNIDFVFDSDPKSIKMWRNYGIFVFNCCQHDEEF